MYFIHQQTREKPHLQTRDKESRLFLDFLEFFEVFYADFLL